MGHQYLFNLINRKNGKSTSIFLTTIKSELSSGHITYIYAHRSPYASTHIIDSTDGDIESLNLNTAVPEFAESLAQAISIYYKSKISISLTEYIEAALSSSDRCRLQFVSEQIIP